MKYLLAITIIILTSLTAPAQDVTTLSKKEQRKILKEEKKRLEAEMAKISMAYLDTMITHSYFVLEADMLFDRYGQSYMVQSTINFILVDSLYGIIQVGDPMMIGRNGVGGITLEGEVSNYKFKKSSKGIGYFLEYTLKTPLGSYDVTLNTGPGIKAEATVRGTFSGSIRYSGDLIYPSASNVFKGMSL